MRTYRLRFKGSGFLLTMPPDGRDIIDGFSCTMFVKGSSEPAAKEAGLAALYEDRTVAGMIEESYDAEVYE